MQKQLFPDKYSHRGSRYLNATMIPEEPLLQSNFLLLMCSPILHQPQSSDNTACVVTKACASAVPDKARATDTPADSIQLLAPLWLERGERGKGGCGGMSRFAAACQVQLAHPRGTGRYHKAPHETRMTLSLAEE